MEFFVKEDGKEEMYDATLMRLQEGDVICLKLNSVLPLNHCKALRDNVQSVFPNNKVFLLTHDVDIGIIRGDEDES